MRFLIRGCSFAFPYKKGGLMEPYTIARVILLPDGDIHIAYHNRQTYYCTPRSLLLLLSEPLQFVDQGRDFLDISTYIVNKKNDLVEKIQGLTLLTVYSDKHFVCEFTELFKLMYTPYILSSAKSNQNMRLTFETLQSFTRDDKQDLILLYMVFTQSTLNGAQKKKRKIDISAEAQSKIVSEIINTTLKSKVKRAENEGDVSTVMDILNEKTNISERMPQMDENLEETESLDLIEKDNAVSNDTALVAGNGAASPQDTFITLEEFARKHNVKERTVKEWINKGKVKSAHCDKNRKYWIDPNEPVIDLRANRKVEERKDGTGRKSIRIKGDSYADVQKYIEERGLVTSAVRPYIRIYKEMKYYEQHYYHEVKWETGSALIIDINPDYYCKTEGKTNREIIASGGSPVVPGNEGYRYHLHHIGQKPESPFAIIPEYDHNSTELYSIFHQGKASKEDLHDKNYEEQKRLFWKTYIKYYDQCGSFFKISYLNPKSKRKQVK